MIKHAIIPNTSTNTNTSSIKCVWVMNDENKLQLKAILKLCEWAEKFKFWGGRV